MTPLIRYVYKRFSLSPGEMRVTGKKVPLVKKKLGVYSDNQENFVLYEISDKDSFDSELIKEILLDALKNQRNQTTKKKNIIPQFHARLLFALCEASNPSLNLEHSSNKEITSQ